MGLAWRKFNLLFEPRDSGFKTVHLPSDRRRGSRRSALSRRSEHPPRALSPHAGRRVRLPRCVDVQARTRESKPHPRRVAPVVRRRPAAGLASASPSAAAACPRRRRREDARRASSASPPRRRRHRFRRLGAGAWPPAAGRRAMASRSRPSGEPASPRRLALLPEGSRQEHEEWGLVPLPPPPPLSPPPAATRPTPPRKSTSQAALCCVTLVMKRPTRGGALGQKRATQPNVSGPLPFQGIEAPSKPRRRRLRRVLRSLIPVGGARERSSAAATPPRPSSARRHLSRMPPRPAASRRRAGRAAWRPAAPWLGRSGARPQPPSGARVAPPPTGNFRGRGAVDEGATRIG